MPSAPVHDLGAGVRCGLGAACGLRLAAHPHPAHLASMSQTRSRRDSETPGWLATLAANHQAYGQSFYLTHV